MQFKFDHLATCLDRFRACFFQIWNINLSAFSFLLDLKYQFLGLFQLWNINLSALSFLLDIEYQFVGLFSDMKYQFVGLFSDMEYQFVGLFLNVPVRHVIADVAADIQKQVCLILHN